MSESLGLSLDSYTHAAMAHRLFIDLSQDEPDIWNPFYAEDEEESRIEPVPCGTQDTTQPAEEEEPEPEPEEKSFQLCAKRLFLTYPRCGALRERVKGVAESVATEQKLRLTGWCIATETHADGEPHLHALFEYSGQVRTRDPRLFDFQDDGKVYHPNMQSARSWKKVLAYIQKCGDFEVGGVFGPEGNPIELAERGDVRAAISCFRERWPLQYMVRKSQVEANLLSICHESQFVVGAPEYVLSQFNVPQSVVDWSGSFRQSKTLVLGGPGGTGKTSLARALLPEGFIANGIEDLRRCKDFSRGVILDDPSQRRWDHSMLVNLLERAMPRTIDARFTDVAIPPKTTMIITCNDYLLFFPAPTHCRYRAIQRRMVFCQIEENDLFVVD